MNKEELSFVTFCIGALSRHLQISRSEIYNRLKESGILYDYIVPCFDVLHSFGSDYIVDDLCELMKKKGVL